MVGGGDHYDVARHLVELHNEERDNPLDLAGFVRVATFLTDSVELVEEQDARPGSNVVAKRPEPGIGLPEVTAHERIVAAARAPRRCPPRRTSPRSPEDR